jgi:hypothetical protein
MAPDSEGMHCIARETFENTSPYLLETDAPYLCYILEYVHDDDI